MKDIKVEFDKNANAVYIQLCKTTVGIRSIAILDDDITIDYRVDANKVVGIEILGVKSIKFREDK